MNLRRATPEDAKLICQVFLRARERMSYLPNLHSDDETLELVRGILKDHEVWVAEQQQSVIGFASLHGTLLEHLYVHPMAQGFGIGSALLDRIKAQSPSELESHVFQKNPGARRFFEARGFKLIELGDGSRNDEQEPDALYAWKP